MANKVMVTCALAVGIGLGFAGAMIMSASADDDPIVQAVVEPVNNDKTEIARPLPSSDTAEIRRLQGELERVRAELETNKTTVDDLNEKLQTPPQAPPPAPDKPAAADNTTTNKKTTDTAWLDVPPHPALPLDGWRSADDFKDIEWGKAGALTKRLGEIVNTPRDELSPKDREHLNWIGHWAMSLPGKLYYRLQSNAKFHILGMNHPFTIVTIFGEVLEAAGHPFSPAQISLLEGIGKQYEKALTEIDARATATTPLLAKLLDELYLRQDALESIVATLTGEQNDILYNPSQNRPVGLMFGPLHDLRQMTMALKVESKDALSQDFISNKVFVTYWQLPLGIAVQSDYVAKQWFDSVRGDISSSDDLYKPVGTWTNGLPWSDPQAKKINPNGNQNHYEDPFMWYGYTPADKVETLSSHRAEFEKLMRFGRAEAQAIGDILRTPSLPKDAIATLMDWEELIVFAFPPPPPPKQN